MREVIKNFNKQFGWEPKVINGEKLATAGKFLVCGMGGSALSAGLIKIIDPKINLIIHRDYDLPNISDLDQRLIILSSYSGNTEEVLSAFDKAKEKNLHLAVIASDGQLLEKAFTGIASLVFTGKLKSLQKISQLA